jgi:hypothetical protein
MDVGDKVISRGGREYEIMGKTENGLIIADQIQNGVPMFQQVLFTEELLTVVKPARRVT